MTNQPAELSIGQYLLQRLQDYGIDHVFGIPGDYVLSFYSMMEKSPVEAVGCTREDCAGFAADAYARVKGMGAVCVTYCVGGLSVCNSIAGAFAEKSPVIVISGSPGMSERHNNPLLHHKVREFRTQMEVFEKLCIAGSELNDPLIAFREIDRVLDAASRFKRPGYLELPRDMVTVVPQTSPPFTTIDPTSDPQAVRESSDEAAEMIAKAKKPVILAGVEVHRFGLQDDLLAFAEKTNIPIASTLLGKSVIRETHPLYVGIYEGAMGHDNVTQFVEESDCVVLLGAFMTDINLGIYTADLDPNKCVYATSEQLRIRHHHYHGVQLGDFIRALGEKIQEPSKREAPSSIRTAQPPFELQADDQITISRMITILNEHLEDDITVIADIGDSLFSATDLTIQGRTDFLSPAYYTSMGFSVPAALGAYFGQDDCRPLVICGDGAFQMTGQEFSTLVRNKIPAIVIVLDNHGYGTERFLHEGEWEYNEILPWNYAKLPEVYGGGKGYVAATEGEFSEAFASATADRSGPSLIQVKIEVGDSSQALRRLADRLSKVV